jgi:hypothetical protein
MYKNYIIAPISFYIKFIWPPIHSIGGHINFI